MDRVIENKKIFHFKKVFPGLTNQNIDLASTTDTFASNVLKIFGDDKKVIGFCSLYTEEKGPELLVEGFIKNNTPERLNIETENVVFLNAFFSESGHVKFLSIGNKDSDFNVRITGDDKIEE